MIGSDLNSKFRVKGVLTFLGGNRLYIRANRNARDARNVCVGFLQVGQGKKKTSAQQARVLATLRKEQVCVNRSAP